MCSCTSFSKDGFLFWLFINMENVFSIKINENIFDDEVAESVDITPSTSIEEVEAPIEKHVVEEPKVDDKPLVEEEPKFVEEEPKVVEEPEKIVVENLDVDDEPKKIVLPQLVSH